MPPLMKRTRPSYNNLIMLVVYFNLKVIGINAFRLKIFPILICRNNKLTLLSMNHSLYRLGFVSKIKNLIMIHVYHLFSKKKRVNTD